MKEPITILHLSDIQYGPHHVDKDKGNHDETDYSSQLDKLKSDLKILDEKKKIKPNFIVITGDIAETSDQDEYKLAEEFIGGIAEHLKIDRRFVAMIPGNHDISWKLCKEVRKKEGKLFDPKWFGKFEYYKNFFHGFYKNIQYPKGITPYTFSEKLFVNFYYPDEGVAFVGLNSCVDESDEEPHYGNIGVEQLKEAIKKLNEFDNEKKMLRIALIHHNTEPFSSTDRQDYIKNIEDLKYLFVKEFDLILHGHQHSQKKGSVSAVINGRGQLIDVLATGSAGLDSDSLLENSRRYQIIDIRNDNQVKVYRRCFDNSLSHDTGRGYWKPDLAPDQEKWFYIFELSTSRVYRRYSDNILPLDNGRELEISIEREYQRFMMNNIKEYFKNKPNSLVLYGESPSVEKKFIDDLSNTLGNEYIVLIVTFQGFNDLESLDKFVFDLTEQLINSFNAQIDSQDLINPVWNEKEKIEENFYKYWKDIHAKKVPVIILNEIGSLRSASGKIILFLDNFMNNSEKGLFILVAPDFIHDYGENLCILFNRRGLFKFDKDQQAVLYL